MRMKLARRCLKIFALELVLVGKGDCMHDKIEPVPTSRQDSEEFVEAVLGGDVGLEHEIAVKALGQRANALAQRLALIGKGQHRALAAHRLGDAPGDRAFISDAHYQAFFPRHQRHRLPQSFAVQSILSRRQKREPICGGSHARGRSASCSGAWRLLGFAYDACAGGPNARAIGMGGRGWALLALCAAPLHSRWLLSRRRRAQLYGAGITGAARRDRAGLSQPFRFSPR